MARSVLFSCLLILCMGSAYAQATITVDARTGLVLGKQPDVSANLFGVTAFEGGPGLVADRDYRARLAALRPGCVRFSAGSTWFAPDHYDPAWYDTPEAARRFEQTLLFGDRYPFGRILPVVREIGAEPMASLGGAPKYMAYKGTSRPADFDQWAAYCTGLIGLWRKFDPRLRYVQIWNEPNGDWWQDERVKKDGPTAADLHVEMANKVATALKQRFPGLQVGGPVLCWPPAWPPDQKGQKPWYTWEQWTLPWLKGTKDTINFFDFHVYDVSPEDFAVQTEMVRNAAQLLQGRELPIWITESNYSVKEDELRDPAAIWSQRMLPYERFLLRGVLPQADKIAGNLTHDLHAKLYTLLPRGADDPDPMYWLLWIMRDLRGKRIEAVSSDPALPVFATLEDDCVTVLAFNDSAQAKTVAFEAALPGGWWTGPDVRAIGPDDKGRCQRLTLSVQCKHEGGKAVGTLQLPAYATASVNLRLDHFPTLARQIVRQELFGDRTLQFIKNQPVKVALPGPQGPAKVSLRVGLLGPEATDVLGARLNGVELPLQATALQEIPLPAGAVKESNELEVYLKQPSANPRLALGFASLVVETRP